MKFFIDSANLEEIKEANRWGVVAGVTTNPSLAAKEAGGFEDMIKAIAAIVDGPVSAEVISTGSEGMIREARTLVQWAPNIVVKIPMTIEGLKAIKVLSREGIRTNVTLIFSVNQALMAARAGGTYVSPFVGRLDDTGANGMKIVEDIANIFAIHDIAAEIIAASMRHPLHVTAAAIAGAHIATVPFSLLTQMVKHPLTDAGIQQFMKDWERAGKQTVL
jgi:transaldolase